MNIMSGIVVFVTLWWIIFFMALPFGAKAPGKHTQGHEKGAPARTHLRLKMLITTGLAILLWVGVDYLIARDFINFRELGNDL